MSRTALVLLVTAVAAFGCGSSTPTQQDAAPLGTRIVGDPCEANRECQSTQCLTDPIMLQLIGRDGGVSTYGGYCFIFPCIDDAQCGPGAHCFDATPFGAPTTLCLHVCQTPADCKDAQGQPRPNYECIQDVQPDGGGTPPRGCVPGGLLQFDGGVADDAATD